MSAKLIRAVTGGLLRSLFGVVLILIGCFAGYRQGMKQFGIKQQRMPRQGTESQEREVWDVRTLCALDGVEERQRKGWKHTQALRDEDSEKAVKGGRLVCFGFVTSDYLG